MPLEVPVLSCLEAIVVLLCFFWTHFAFGDQIDYYCNTKGYQNNARLWIAIRKGLSAGYTMADRRRFDIGSKDIPDKE